jgi:uncharacterized protein YaaN involved in tellurite resistance
MSGGGGRGSAAPEPPIPPDPTHAIAAGLELSPPAPVLQVLPEEAEKAIPIAPDMAGRIDGMVAGLVDVITSLDAHSDEYRRRIDEINGIGEREMIATAEMSNRLVDRPLRAMSGVLGGQAPIARDILELRRIVEDLNPARYDLARIRPRKLLGVIPVGDRLRSYFDRYTKAQSQIQAIIWALADGRNNLQADSAAIAQEERALWTEMETLRQYAYMAQRLDEALERRIRDLSISDGAHARALGEDVLFPVRQRRQDILTQLAVATQGYAALRIVRDNNQQVVRAIQTATTTTVAALRTAVMVARSLTDQRLVLDQLKAAKDSTSSMIEGASALAMPTAAGGEAQVSGARADLAALQRAWDRVFVTLNQIDAYEAATLEAMVVTVRGLKEQIGRSRALGEGREQADDRAQGSMLRIP